MTLNKIKKYFLEAIHDFEKIELVSINDTNLTKFIKYVKISEKLYTTVGKFIFDNTKEKYNIRSDILPRLLYVNELRSLFKEEIVNSFDPQLRNFSFFEIQDVGKLLCDKNVFVGEQSYFIDDSFNFEKLSEIIYKQLSFNKFFLDIEITIGQFGIPLLKTSLTKLNNQKIINNNSFDKVKKIINTKGSFLFYGPPGTGKSSFIFIDELKDKKIIKMLSSSFFNNLNLQNIKELIKIFKPDIIVIEEVDKCGFSVDKILVYLETIKTLGVTVVFTANDLKKFSEDKAAIRPQRIDKIIHFDLPDKAEVEQLVKEFCADLSLHDFDRLVNLFLENNFSQAYIVDLCEKYVSFDETKEYVEFLKGIK